MNINDRLFNELFYKKKVKYNQKLYIKYYNRIWKNDNYFKKFLQSGSEDIQKDISKRIVNRLFFNSVFPMPDSFFSSLMNCEYVETKESAGNYQGQIHSVHSVMLYILGVWIFFNHQTFNRYIKEQFAYKRVKTQFETNEEIAIKMFLSAWKAFSLCHDIGYTLETSTNNNGVLKQKEYNDILDIYNNMDLVSYYDLTLKSLAKLIFVQCVIDISTYNLKNFLNDIKEQEISINEEIIRYLGDNYTRLKNIRGYEQLKSFLPFIDINDIFVVTKDKNYNIVCIALGQNMLYKNPELYSTDINPLYYGSEESSEQLYYNDYYIRKLNDVIKQYHFNIDMRPYYDYFKQITKSVKKKIDFKVLVSVDYVSNENIQYNIYEYLKDNLSFNVFKSIIDQEKIEYDHDEEKTTKEIIIKNISSLLSNYSYSESDENMSNKIYDYMLQEINKEDFYKKIVKDIMNHNDESSISFLNAYFALVSKDYPKKSYKYILVTGSKNKKKQIKYELFNSHKTNKKNHSQYWEDELSKIMTHIKQQCVFLGLGNTELVIDNILNYCPKHSCFDHGIVSSSLLAQTFVTYKEIYNNSTLSNSFIDPLLKSMLNQNKNAINKNDKCYYEAILAILMHNIYPKRFNDIYHINFKQDLSKNAFCYFAALCDTLQKWDRPKTINYAENSYLGEYITGKNYDLIIENNSIYIESISTKINNAIYNYKTVLDEFLEHGSDFIKLSIKEGE